ncbi:phosphoribosylanthranilate isomerase [Candidatus Carsonella ruddii]|uniref:phosphoribosylanthranilate isomerase n=1 Tax=Carsonella ruddii TaxID=114186 RepID=UPI003D9A7925
MKIKFCGVKNKNDILKAILCKANLIGFNFYKKSKRYINGNFFSLLKYIPSYIYKIALFVNEEYNVINKLKKYFDLLQFHGNESFIFCESFKKKYIKTIKINKKIDFNVFYSSNNFFSFLIDKKSFQYGGSGNNFQIFKNLKKNFFISGGIDIFNINKIKRISSSYYIDICSGLEFKEIKNIKKMLKIN